MELSRNIVGMTIVTVKDKERNLNCFPVDKFIDIIPTSGGYRIRYKSLFDTTNSILIHESEVVKVTSIINELITGRN